MNDEVEVEERLAASMRDHVAGITLDSAILSRAGRRHRRRKVVQRSAFALGAVALAAGVALAAPDRAPHTGDQEGGTARTRLVAAVTASQSTSYQVTITVQITGEVKEKSKSVTLTGAYDPASGRGYLRMGDFEEHLVDGTRYVLVRENAKDLPDYKTNPLGFEWPGGQGFLGTSVDPAALLDSLRRRDAKITEAGAGVFPFELRVERKMPDGTEIVAFSGEVTVGADNRVAKVAYKAVVSGARNVEITTVMHFSHYGEPVVYEKP
jgi:hypothetical protein